MSKKEISCDNLGFPHNVDDDYDDEDLVKKKEAQMNKSDLKKAVFEVIDECLIPYTNSEEQIITGRMNEAQRLHVNEKKITAVEAQVDDLAADSLKLSRRVASINKRINALNIEITDLQTEIKLFKERTKAAADEADKFETKHDITWEKRRDTILRVAVIVIAAIAVIISIVSYYKGGTP